MNYPIQWLYNFHSTKRVNFWTFHHNQQCVLGHLKSGTTTSLHQTFVKLISCILLLCKPTSFCSWNFTISVDITGTKLHWFCVELNRRNYHKNYFSGKCYICLTRVIYYQVSICLLNACLILIFSLTNDFNFYTTSRSSGSKLIKVLKSYIHTD